MAKPTSFTLSPLPEHYAILKFPAESPMPDWAMTDGFFSITRTSDELSVVTPLRNVPQDLLRNFPSPWRVFKVHGPFALNEVGVLASLAAPLAQAGISIFVISTHDTDYLLVNVKTFEAAMSALLRAGHRVAGSV